MGKPFEVIYSPDVWNVPQGGIATQWVSSYGGLNVQEPENSIAPNATPDVDNFMFRNKELRSRPRFKQLFPGPDGTNYILGCGSFLSPNQVLHTFCLTPRGLWQLKTYAFEEIKMGRSPWDYLGGPPLSTAPCAWASYAGVLYYGNGQNLAAWDGAAQAPISDVAFSGATYPPNPASQTVYGGVFLGELANHLILAYVTETLNGVSTPYANRVRWSNNGFNPMNASGVFGGNLGTAGATFDPAINSNAGFNDFIDCPDIITGLMTLGRTAYVFRQNGITEMQPTGRGAAPYDFNHLWASQHGVGNVYPFSVAQYGNMGVFISFEQIYQITPGGMQPIGGSARDAILGDLSLATGSPKASIDRGFTLGYSYLVYHLRIPMAEGTRSYVWSQEDNSWTRWTHSAVWPTGIANECWV